MPRVRESFAFADQTIVAVISAHQDVYSRFISWFRRLLLGTTRSRPESEANSSDGIRARSGVLGYRRVGGASKGRGGIEGKREAMDGRIGEFPDSESPLDGPD